MHRPVPAQAGAGQVQRVALRFRTLQGSSSGATRLSRAAPEAARCRDSALACRAKRSRTPEGQGFSSALGSGGSQAPGWVIPERNEFLWVLSYDGPEGFPAKDSAYYASAERGALEPDPVQFIARAERWFVTPVAVRP